MSRNSRQLIRDIIISVLICLILLAAFWTQRRREIVKDELRSAPIYSSCPRDEYPCQTGKPWNSRENR